MSFGPVLRTWRTRRGLSQEGLALLAGTSARHVSRLETGRVRPSAAMVRALAASLEVPSHGVVDLLASAGLAVPPASGAAPVAGADLLAAVRRVLDAHEPYPAFALDRHWDVVAHNRAAGRLLGLLDPAAVHGRNALRVALHAGGLPSLATDDAPWRAPLVARAAEQAARHPGGRLARVLRAYGGTPDPRAPADVAVAVRLRLPTGDVALLAVATRLAVPGGPAAAELMIDTLLPADAASQTVLDRFARDVRAGHGRPVG